MMGLSTRGSISFGCALVAERKRVPNPAAGKIALRTGRILRRSLLVRRSGVGFIAESFLTADCLGRSCGRGRPPPSKASTVRQPPAATATPGLVPSLRSLGGDFVRFQLFQ